MRICVGCPRVQYYTEQWNAYLEAVSNTWPGAKMHVIVHAPFVWKNKTELARDLRKSDVLTLLEFEGYIDRTQYQLYRKARKMKKPIYAFRDGFFVKVIRARLVNWSDEKRRIALLTTTSGNKPALRPAKLY